MENLAWLAILTPLLGIGVVVVFIVAVIQEGKSERRGFKQAFFIVVTLVMLGISVGATIGLFSTTMRQYVFPDAKNYARRFNSPPPLFLTGTTSTLEGVKPAGPPLTSPYTCTTDCQFTAEDKISITNWQTSYRQWRDEEFGTLTFRRDVATLLPFLIVALPLFIIFFRLMQRGAASELAETKKISPLRSLYFYFIAFSGLLIAVIGAGGTINIGLNRLLNTSDPTMNEPIRSAIDDGAVKSIITCADKCGFSTADVKLAQDWISDTKAFTTRTQSGAGRTGNDLANFLPLLFVGIPLFWYHFNRIRKETQETHSPTRIAS